MRLLYWQDHGLFVYYWREAQRLLDGGGAFFPTSPPESGDATMVLHPPGYSMLMQGIFGIFGSSESAIAVVQVICDGIAAAMVVIIAAELFPLTIAFVSGMLVALSPHLAYYSLHLSPETLAVLPLLLAIYFFVRACNRPRPVSFITAGLFIGLSCWLRSNAMLLAPFVAIAFIILFCGKQVRNAALMAVTTVLVIAPITIRNWIVFHQFIPLSIGAGVTLMEGIADYDHEGRFGFPKLDWDVQRQEAELYGRPVYARNLEDPDGIERDRARFARGLAVVRSNPIWFSGVMVRRAAFMLRYNDSSPHEWPFYTATVPIISAEPTPARSLQITEAMQPVWANSPREFVAEGKVISAKAKVWIDDKNEVFYLEGDDTDYGDQLVSESINVQKKTDHMLAIPVKLNEGLMAIKVTTADGSMILASTSINSHVEKTALLERRRKKKSGVVPVAMDITDGQSTIVRLPFATGNRTQVRIALANNGPSPVRPVLRLGDTKLFGLGETPYSWTRYPRVFIRSVQKKLFTTIGMLPLIIAGIAFAGLAGRGRALFILLIVPTYYLCIQSALHTEYRYTLAIHYFLFVTAAVAIFCFSSAVWQVMTWLITALSRRSIRQLDTSA